MSEAPANTRAILLLVAAMAFFAGVDAFVKLTSETQDVGQILTVSSAATFVIFVAILKLQGGLFWDRGALNAPLLIRSTGEVVGSVGIVFALATAPFSSVMSLAQAQPLAVVMGAALFLNETVGWRRWAAVGLGAIGVLIILRPGQGSFDANLLWVLVYIFGLAIRDLATRRLPGQISTAFAVAWSMLPMIVAGWLIMEFQGGWRPISPYVTALYSGMVLSVSAALWTLTSAMRIGEISAIAPFRYTRIVFALFIGFVLFDDIPDFWTWMGVGLIVGSGTYAFLRERSLAQR